MKKLIENSENIFYYDNQINVPRNVKKVIVVDGVESIDSMAFYDCRELEEITIPNSVKSIFDSAFEYCVKLKSVVIPESVIEIDNEAFYGCSVLTNVKILGNPQIAGNAFDKTPLENEFHKAYDITDSELDDAIYTQIKDDVEKSFVAPEEKLITEYNITKYANEIIDFIEKNFGSLINKSFNRGHILPNGDFLSNPQISAVKSAAHRHMEMELADLFKEKLGYSFIGFDFSGQYGDSIFDLIGCIRVNGEHENYIAIPKQKITSAQQRTLYDWIEWFFWKANKRQLKITTMDMYSSIQQHTYDRNEYDVDEIMQKIMRYYNTGTLYESKQKVGEEKVKTVKYCMPFELPKDIKSILKNSGNEKLLSNVYENDYKIKISNVGKNYRGLVESLNRVYTEKCVNYNSYTDTITVFKNYKETIGSSSIGQHKRSSIDLIPEDDGEINKFNVYDDAEDYEYLLELEPDFDTDYVEDEDDSDYLYEDDTDDSEETENSETDELIINDISTNNTNTIKPNINNNDTTIYKGSDDDLEVNVDSEDSTNPMDDFQNRKSNNTSISI